MLLQELNGDLVRRYQKHKVEIETLWRSFNTEQRTRCLPDDPGDFLGGRHQHTIPEWTLRNMAESGPDFALTLLKDRATTSVMEQFLGPMPSGGPGDREFILKILFGEDTLESIAIEAYTAFAEEGENYGRMSPVPDPLDEEAFEQLSKGIERQVFLPEDIGSSIMMRQTLLAQMLLHLTNKIFSEAAGSCFVSQRSENGVLGAFEKLPIQQCPSIQEPPPLADLMASAEERNQNVQEYLSLLCTDPAFLEYAIQGQFDNRSELLPDKNGAILFAHTDKYISRVVLEVMHDAVQDAAIWDYIYQLLKLLEEKREDEAYRTVILQELSNVCYHVYSQAKAAFRRTLQWGAGTGCFTRRPGAVDKGGNALVKMDCNLADLAITDPYLHCLLCLCQQETTWSDATAWLKKLGGIYDAQPLAICRISVAVGFIGDISSAFALPPASRQKGQVFMGRLHDQIDIRDFVTPIAVLRKPEVAKGALQALDEFIIDKVGTKMGFLYGDLVKECLGPLEKMYQREKARMEKRKKKKQIQNAEWIPFPTATEETSAQRVEQRRQKEKTRPAHSSPYDISPTAPAAEELSVATSAAPVFKASSSTAKVFSTLFDKTQSRGAINWVDFESAMVELGFSVTSVSGSGYTFVSTKEMGLRNITIHRPHEGRIEGYRTLILARRLTKVYGWGEKTFETA
ncbi:hypothetical protein B0I37DRAFT_394415 [Chaetomium sp. MPI-CAGE-AT-0009]|nr:hypothetical protein B0I37DRAFT_394415 [Chaetomium sp. MPI-CAGE-AT-0009]